MIGQIEYQHKEDKRCIKKMIERGGVYNSILGIIY